MIRGDEVKYMVMKDYNGHKFVAATFSDLGCAKRWAKATVDRENRGKVLTLRVFRQVYYCRRAKVTK